MAERAKLEKNKDRNTKLAAAIVCSTGLSACSGSSESLTTSTNTTSFSRTLVEVQGDTVNIDSSTGGYTFEVGMNQSRSEFVSQAVLLDGTDIPAPTAQGSATMTGTYRMETFQNPVTDQNGLTGDRLSRDDDITVQVNFDNNSFTAEETGLVLNGQFDATGRLTGTAAFGDMAGELVGEVGDTSTVGIFDGDSTTGVFAGGFVATN